MKPDPFFPMDEDLYRELIFFRKLEESMQSYTLGESTRQAVLSLALSDQHRTRFDHEAKLLLPMAMSIWPGDTQKIKTVVLTLAKLNIEQLLQIRDVFESAYLNRLSRELLLPFGYSLGLLSPEIVLHVDLRWPDSEGIVFVGMESVRDSEDRQNVFVVVYERGRQVVKVIDVHDCLLSTDTHVLFGLYKTSP